MTSTNTTAESFSTKAYLAELEKRNTQTEDPFHTIPLPTRQLKESNWNNYRIYKNAKEFVVVEGEAAYDAIAKSGVANPLRVVRAMKEVGDLLTNQELVEETEAVKERVERLPESGIIPPPTAA